MADPDVVLFPVSDDVADRIASLLLALSDVGGGKFDVELEVDLPVATPLGQPTVCINQLTRTLALARTESLRFERELEERIAVIERQKAAMRELATPIIEVWRGVICLPVVGVIDTMRSSEMTDSLL